jgi:1,2-dihydroxy-3-keto-5-methylthiopentene dioxygenase
MSQLTICRAADAVCLHHLDDHAAIAARLAARGVRFERWTTEQPLAAAAGQDEVLAAYAAPVAALNAEYGFRSVDVVALGPDHPQRAELRRKFLAEHTHDDFEVRFFVDGRGLFYLHLDDEVWMVLCEKGDLISVPAGTTHWFDMGERPDFACIRFFTVPEGWVGHFTGSDIAGRFPSFDEHVAAPPA